MTATIDRASAAPKAGTLTILRAVPVTMVGGAVLGGVGVVNDCTTPLKPGQSAGGETLPGDTDFSIGVLRAGEDDNGAPLEPSIAEAKAGETLFWIERQRPIRVGEAVPGVGRGYVLGPGDAVVVECGQAGVHFHLSVTEKS